MPQNEAVIRIRDAEDHDLPRVRDIYAHYVTHSTVTFDEEAPSLAEWQELLAHTRALGHPFLVADAGAGQTVGYARVMPWKPKGAYRFTVENSIYVHDAATGQGIGRALLTELLDRAQASGIREVIAVIVDQGADASLALHRSQGFVEVGRMERVGHKFDRWLGTVLLQKSLGK